MYDLSSKCKVCGNSGKEIEEKDGETTGYIVCKYCGNNSYHSDLDERNSRNYYTQRDDSLL